MPQRNLTLLPSSRGSYRQGHLGPGLFAASGSFDQDVLVLSGSEPRLSRGEARLVTYKGSDTHVPQTRPVQSARNTGPPDSPAASRRQSSCGVAGAGVQCTHRRPFCTTRLRQFRQQAQAWLHSNSKGGSAMLNSGSSRPSWGQTCSQDQPTRMQHASPRRALANGGLWGSRGWEPGLPVVALPPRTKRMA